MRLNLHLLAAGGILAFTLSCSSDRPTSPFGTNVSALIGAQINPDELRALTSALFDGHSGTMNQLEQMLSSQPATPAQINGGENVIKKVLEWLALGTLNDPDGDGPFTAETGALRLINMINVALDRPEQLIDEPDPDADFAIQVVGPDTDELIITSQEDAGVKIAPGQFLAQTLLTIIRQDDSPLGPPPGKAAKSAVFDVSISPIVDFQPFVLAICPNEHLSPAQLAKALIYHYNESLEKYDDDPLAPADWPEGFVCGGHTSSAPVQGGLRGWLASVGRTAMQAVSPRTLYAGHGGLAGTVGSLSPFVMGGPAQEETELTLSLPDSVIFGFAGPIGATLTADGAAVEGETIDFTVNSLTPSAVTNGSGVATWTYSQPPVGNFAVTATFTETDDYFGSSANGTLRVRYTHSFGRAFTSPIPNSKYSFGRTVPLKFQLFRWDPATSSYVVHGGANVRLTACRMTGSSCGTQIWAPESAPSFRYDGVEQYILNLDSRLLVTKGNYQFTAILDDSTTILSGIITIN
jgi:hypothetical protein